MRYMGSKLKHAKSLIPVIMSGHVSGSLYVEPFCGGGNMLYQVPEKNKWGNDTAKYAIALLDAISKGYVPPSNISEFEYRKVKDNPEHYPPEYVGFLAYSCSYAGKFWGGFCRGTDNKGVDRNFASEQVRQLLTQQKGLRDCLFTSMSYLNMDIPTGSTVYCDPPYAGTTKYQSEFNHSEFWDWVFDLSNRCSVFVSEYTAPDYMEVLWESTVTSSLTRDTGSKVATEKLFKFKG